MKQTKIDVEVQTNLTGSRRMGVDLAAMGHILSMLSNVYSDPNLAVVREYASNAFDSHRVARNPDPILVTSPSHFNPVLTVQDFGTGLSMEEMLDVYAVYGTSTKRDRDDQIGHFGIGAKSAFTAGTQFVVTAVKDSMRAIVLFALDEEGAPTVNPVSHDATDEPNGVKVEIGIRDVDGVTGAIERLFPTWPRGTVMVDGVEPNSIWDKAEKIEDDIHIAWANRVEYHPSAWTVIMGGIPYTLSQDVVNALEYRTRTIVQRIQNSQALVYLTVPLGGVDITPSREQLRITDKTLATITQMVERFHLALGPWSTAKVANEKSVIGAIIKLSEIKANLGGAVNSSATWNGKPVPSNPIDTAYEWFVLKYRRGGYGDKVARREKDYRLAPGARLRDVLFVTDVPERRVRTVQLAAKEYLSQQERQDQPVKRVVAITDTAKAPGDWFNINDPALRTMDFDQFAKFKPAPTLGQRSPVTYNLAQAVNGYASYQRATVDELRAETTVYYLTHGEYMHTNEKSDLMKEAIGDSPLVVLKSTQKAEVFTKRVPQAVSARTALGTHAMKVLATVTQDDVDALAASAFYRSINTTIVRFLKSEKAKLTNAGALSMIEQWQKARDLLNDPAVGHRMNLIRSAATAVGKDVHNLGTPTWDTGAWDRFQTGLPLMTTYFDRDWNRTPQGNAHVIAYINMIGN